MKAQNVFMKSIALFSLPVLALLLSQCVCCPPLSRSEKPTFTGCWLTEYSRPRDSQDPIKEDIVFKEIPVQITVNADGSINGTWWSFPAPAGEMPATGTLTGNLEGGNRIRGKWGPEPGQDIDFQLSSTGLTFVGTYGPPTLWGTTRRFYWNGTKVSNCECSESIYTTPGNAATYKK